MSARYIHCPHCGHPSVVRREELGLARRCRQCAGHYTPVIAAARIAPTQADRPTSRAARRSA